MQITKQEINRDEIYNAGGRLIWIAIFIMVAFFIFILISGTVTFLSWFAILIFR